MTPDGACDSTAGLVITWNSFNMAAHVRDIPRALNFDMVYDTAHSRIKRCSPNCTNPTATTLYLNDPATGTMAEANISGGTTSWTDYIAASGGIVAIRNSSGGASSYLYVTGDHLGSVSLISDASGGLIAGGRQSYDPWGLRRNPDGTPASSCSAIASATTRGYTGQEEMDSGCLVNLNGRIYYPVIGRMLSADPTVPNPLDGQSYNRYSYVNNNPLNATDPSGYANQGCPSKHCQPKDPDPFGIDGIHLDCFDCGGPGFTSDANGNIVTVESQGFYGYTSTDANGQVITGSARLADLLSGFIATPIPSEAEDSQGITTFTGFIIPPGTVPLNFAWFANPDQPLGSGGEGWLFNIGLAVATLGTSIPEQLGARGVEEITTTTVGRWMSQSELDAMMESGRVQESFNNGVTSVTVPPNATFYRAAPSGDVFTQLMFPPRL